MTTETITRRVIDARFNGVEQHAVFLVCDGEHHGEEIHIPCDDADNGYAIGRIMSKLLHNDPKTIAKAKRLHEALDRYFAARRAEAELANGGHVSPEVAEHFGITDDREWTRAAADIAKCALRFVGREDGDD